VALDFVNTASSQTVGVKSNSFVAGAFSFAWLLGLIVPGAPGGLGVFSNRDRTLSQSFSPGLVIVTLPVLGGVFSLKLLVLD